MDIDSLFKLFDAYCAATGRAESYVSTRVFNDGKRMNDLRAGGDIGVRKVKKAIAWFDANWPQGIAWPKGIARPATAEMPS